ncbi:MAG: RtcB family protein [bacterium]|nr:RtcB family protein [bacterium]
MDKKDLQKISDWLWEIPKDFRKDMRVPARIYASEKILNEIEPDAFSQVINTASLPGIVNYSLAMPDIHTGYGFVIGGVAAMDFKDGVISPGGVGYDINCGMRVLRSEYSEKEIRPHLEKLATEIQNEVPSGLGQGRQIKSSVGEIEKILEDGAQRIVEQGCGEKEDLENCESNGRLTNADVSLVSERAKNRGRNQVGTLGSGNHFLEIQKVEEIFDETAAKAFGLFKDQVLVMIHTGSRGLGHQIATDYIRVMVNAMSKYGIKLPDRELAACPIDSSEGKNYFTAMNCGANYAWANRQAITHFIRKAWKSVLGDSGSKLKVVYDVAHNIAKIENHLVYGEEKKLIVHRKGATRAFPPGHPEIPEKYREVGQPVLIPGSMGTASYILAGTKEGAEAWFSACHGAGRTMSRHAAARAVSPQELIKSLESKGIVIRCASPSGLAEEAPQAYKDIEGVVEVVHQAGLSKKVARLKPLAVIKGE